MAKTPQPTPPSVDVVTVLMRVMGWGRVMAQTVAQGMDADAAKSVEGSYARGDRETIVTATEEVPSRA